MGYNVSVVTESVPIMPHNIH